MAARYPAEIDCQSGACRCRRCGRTIAVGGGFSGVGRHLCHKQPQPGLGDRVAAVLSTVGITEARVASVASRVGIKDCGCRRRREALNRAGRRLGIG